MQKIKSGIIGVGNIGASHIEAVRRINFAEIVAICDANYELAHKKAEEYYISKYCQSVEELLNDPEIKIVHNCTPNYLHTVVNEKIIRAGKHVICEKPLATSSADSAKILALLKQYPNTAACVNFNYRMNPQVIEAKAMIEKGEIGRVQLIHGSYLQDWLLCDTDYNWRLEPEFSGASRAIADIGSHWIDSAQFVTGEQIVSVCADLVTVIPVRKKIDIATGEIEEKAIATEDYGAVLFKMTNGISGVFYVSQLSAGHGSCNNFEVNGTKKSIAWNQERCDELWIGRRDGHNMYSLRSPNIMDPSSRIFTSLGKGCPEGWNDAFKNGIMSFYRFVAEGKRLGVDPTPFTTFEEAHYIVKLVEAIIESAKNRSWVTINNLS